MPLANVIASIAIGLLCCSQASADDDRCRVPPYGMTDREFKAYVDAFGHLVTSSKILPALCNLKYGRGDRTALYNLGFTDREIESKSLAELAVEELTAIRELARKAQ
jgi:hypothetical protein